MAYQQPGQGQYTDPRYAQYQTQGGGQFGTPASNGYQTGHSWYAEDQTAAQGPGQDAATNQGGRAAVYPSYDYAQTYTPQRPAQTSNYNPQHYAQNPSTVQYPVQYANSQYDRPQPAYASASYAAPYQDHYRQASYNPSDYSTTQPGQYGSPQSNTYYPTVSPPVGGSPQISPAPARYSTYSAQPPPVPPRPTSEVPATYATYSSYAQPVAQRATSYQSSLPYPDYDQGAVAMPGFGPDPYTYPPTTNASTNHAVTTEPPTYTPYSNAMAAAMNNSTSRFNSSSQPSPHVDASATPPPPPAHGSQRNSPAARHPQARPLPGPPDQEVRYPTRSNTAEYTGLQNDLFDEVENALRNAGSPVSRLTASPASGVRRRPLNDVRRGDRESSPLRDDDDSDAEAVAGLEAMRVAEEEEIRRNSSQTGRLIGGNATNNAGYDDYARVDMGLYGGGYEANMSYGDHEFMPGSGSRAGRIGSGAGSMPRPPIPGRDLSYDSFREVLQQATPPFQSVARVDSGGTGGLVDPSAELPSAQQEDDGDSYSFTEETVDAGEPPDLFFHPSASSAVYRPLPPPPSSTDSMGGTNTPTTSSSLQGYPLGESVSLPQNNQSDKAVPRFSSLRESTASPSLADHPVRAKTDSRPRKPGLRTSMEPYSGTGYGLPDTPAGNQMTLDLPSLPSKRFNAAKLGAADFKKCEEPWALSAIYSWLRSVANPEQVTELKENMIRDALVALFTNKVPTMNITDAEVLASRVIREMYDAGTLRPSEEWVRLAPGAMSGVVFQLTQGGCYSPRLHEHYMPGRCYAHHCQRTLKKVNLQTTPSRSTEDWATFYKLKKEDVENVDKKEIERQNILHEVVQTEDQFMGQINVLQIVYRDALTAAIPPILDQKRLATFVRDVFGKIDAIRKANEDHLLAQLKYRQQEQGPFIRGFSDIFRQWIRKARAAYIEYAAAFPAASLMWKQEQDRNLHFRDFLEKARANKASNRLGLDTYLKAPITRLQRYSLLLATILKNMKEDSVEKHDLDVAINEIREVTHECDARVAEMQRKVDLIDLGSKLVLRPGMQQEVVLNLNHLGRRLIHQGVLQRTGSSRFNWVDSEVLLFDHYLILAKPITVIQRGTGAKIERFDVSRFPIPMDLLVLEGLNDDPVRQSHYVRGISTVSSVPRTPVGDIGRARASTSTMSSHPGIDRSTTTSSLGSINSGGAIPPAVTVTDGAKEGEKILYPFGIKHLGRDTYTLFAQSAASRAEWGQKIIEAKTQHAKSLYQQNAEPFRLRVLADAAFGYDSFTNTASHKPIIIENTPTDRAVKEVEARYRDNGRPSPICRARVNCATSFFTAYPGKHMLAVGTDFGVYTSEIDNPRGWSKAIAMSNVTQIAVLEEFNVFLLISAGSLIAYHLDVVTTQSVLGNSAAAASDSSSARRAPQKLSGTREVGFFAVGRMKERTLVIYKKRKGLDSTFKVLEPVFQKSSEKKRSMFKRGQTDFFRDFDEFYIPTECSGINLFTSSLCVSTSRGFEVLTLDKKHPISIPNLVGVEVDNIRRHIEGQATLGMLRLSEQEFLLCYEKCAVYVNKHGDVSRSVIMNFVGKAGSVALYGPYLILFDADFVEVRNAQNGRLKQIIAGNDVRCLDDGGGGSLSGGSGRQNNGGGGGGAEWDVGGGAGLGSAAQTVKVAMAHPTAERSQVVVELLLNEGMKD